MKRKQKDLLFDTLVTVIAIILGVIIIFPLIYCFLSSFKTPSEFLNPKLFPSSFLYLDNFKNALERGNLLRYTLNSFVIAFVGTAVRMVLSILAAYAFTFYDFKGKNFFFFLILGTMMIPGDVLLVTNYLTVSKMHLLNTYLGVMIVSFVSASQMFMLRQRFKTIPKDMREASSMDGYGDIWFILRVLLPITRPVVTTLFVQSFISNYQVLILIAGGIILSILGLSMSFSDPFRKMKSGGGRASATDFGQALVMGLTNPGAVFVILTLFAFFGIGSEQHPHSWSIAPVVLAVSGGSVLYWFMVTWALSHFRKKFKMNTILWISRLTGAVVVIMGIALLGQGLFKVIFQGASLL